MARKTTISNNIVPIPALARELSKNGIASISFDFGGHWKSEGQMQQMTVGKEIEDALAIWKYAKSLPYVTSIGILGHSQSGVVASMTAGILSSRGESPAALALIAPGSVIQDAELIVVEGENHMITRKLRTVVSHAVSFFVSQLKSTN